MVDECLFIEPIIHSNGKRLYAYHTLLEAPWILRS